MGSHPEDCKLNIHCHKNSNFTPEFSIYEEAEYVSYFDAIWYAVMTIKIKLSLFLTITL
jgi:hypothetical protein